MAGPRTSNIVVFQTLTASHANTTEDKIRDELYAFCAGLANDLDQKQGIATKYFQVKSNNPTEVDEKADSESRRVFLENFSEFYTELREALDQITKEDIETISREEKSQSEALKKLKQCFEKLNKAGFYNANGRPINFWSGKVAQEEARKTLFSLSDADVPSISIISKLGNLFKDASLRSLSDIAFFAGSALFADQASGNVYVYSSASNKREAERNVFTVNNFHWNIELPVVRARQKAGHVKNIYYTGYSHSKKDWKRCALSLVSLKENEELQEDTKNSAKENYTPMLVRKNKALWIYGDRDGSGSFELTPLNSFPSELLKDLPFDEGGVMRGDDERLTTSLIDALRPGHANWQALFNANKMSQSEFNLVLRRNSMEGFFKLSLIAGVNREKNTIYLQKEKGQDLNYQLIDLSGELKRGIISLADLPRELREKEINTLPQVRNIPSSSFSSIVTHIARKGEITLPTLEQKEKNQEEWVETGAERPSTPAGYLCRLSPSRERSDSNRSDSLSPRARSGSCVPSPSPSPSPNPSLSPSPSPTNRARNDSLSPKQWSFGPTAGQSPRQASPRASVALSEGKTDDVSAPIKELRIVIPS